jgi:hypothetical protein
MDMMAKLVRIMWVPCLLAALYTVWVFWHRHPGAQPARVEHDPMAAYGKTVKILQFYGPREIVAGGKALVCYGVVNATAVRLDPPVEKVWPAVSRCFEITPAQSTRYTLTAEGTAQTGLSPAGLPHTTVSESIEIAVKR